MDKRVAYEELLLRVKSLVGNEDDVIANMANVAAIIKESFGFFWVGFYIVKGEELVLGPFQGPVACTRIRRGRGVCGAAWSAAETVIVPDVELFPGHIACNSASKSEIVIPLVQKGTVTAILDIDSDSINSFDNVDAQYLSAIVSLL